MRPWKCVTDKPRNRKRDGTLSPVCSVQRVHGRRGLALRHVRVDEQCWAAGRRGPWWELTIAERRINRSFCLDNFLQVDATANHNGVRNKSAFFKFFTSSALAAPLKFKTIANLSSPIIKQRHHSKHQWWSTRVYIDPTASLICLTGSQVPDEWTV